MWLTTLAMLISLANAQTKPPEVIKTPAPLPNQVEVVRGTQPAKVETYTSTPVPTSSTVIIIPPTDAVPVEEPPVSRILKSWDVQANGLKVACVASLKNGVWVIENTADEATCLLDPNKPVEVPAE